MTGQSAPQCRQQYGPGLNTDCEDRHDDQPAGTGMLEQREELACSQGPESQMQQGLGFSFVVAFLDAVLEPDYETVRPKATALMYRFFAHFSLTWVLGKALVRSVSCVSSAGRRRGMLRTKAA